MKKPDWPIDMINGEKVRNWISNVMAEHTNVDVPVSINRVKPWGVIARFNIQNIKYGKQEIVFKASQLPLFNYGTFADKLLMEHCSDKYMVLLLTVNTVQNIFGYSILIVL